MQGNRRSIIGNLDENGYLTASLEELAQDGKYSQDDVEEAIAVVQDFDPIGVGARNLRECLLLQLKALRSAEHSGAADCFRAFETGAGQPAEGNRARAESSGGTREARHGRDQASSIPRPGLRYNKTEPRLVEPDVYFRKVDDQWQVFMNEDDMPQLRLSPTYRRLLARDAADRDVRNYVKERFTAAIQLMKNIEQRKHTILRVCQSIIARQGEFLDHGPDT